MQELLAQAALELLQFISLGVVGGSRLPGVFVININTSLDQYRFF